MAISETKKQYFRDSYAWYKSHGICVECHSERAEPNKARCFECLEKGRLRVEKHRKQNPELAVRAREAAKARYDRLKAAGICTVCGQKSAYKGHGTCYWCMLKKARLQRGYREGTQKHYRERGLCTWCGQEREKGYMLCSACLERLAKAGAKGRAVQREKGQLHQV